MKFRLLTGIFVITFTGLLSCGSKTETPKKDTVSDTTAQDKTATKNEETIPLDDANSVDPNSSPENAVKAMIKAGKTGNYEQLGKLCNNAIDMDGDAKDICGLAEGKGNKEEYNDFFGNASIKATRIKGNMAEVDIKTTAEGGEEETIILEQKDNKWYLKGL